MATSYNKVSRLEGSLPKKNKKRKFDERRKGPVKPGLFRTCPRKNLDTGDRMTALKEDRQRNGE